MPAINELSFSIYLSTPRTKTKKRNLGEMYKFTSSSFQTYFTTALILERAETLAKKEPQMALHKFEQTAQIHTIGFRQWRNKIMKLKLKSVFFVKS